MRVLPSSTSPRRISSVCRLEETSSVFPQFSFRTSSVCRVEETSSVCPQFAEWRRRPQFVLSFSSVCRVEETSSVFPQFSFRTSSVCRVGGDVLSFLSSGPKLRTEASSSVLSFLGFPPAVPTVRCCTYVLVLAGALNGMGN